VPHKLLLADDSVTIQRVIELTFADEDVQVVAVSDGDQAIARLDAEPPDIVLVDVGMPGKNGYEVASYVKHTPRLAHIPVLLLTGASEPVDRARADSLRCDGVLAKPFEPQLVIGRVKELLNRRGRAGGNDNKPAAPVPGATAAATPTAAELDGYFDRLDAAFASMGGTRQANAPPIDLPLSYSAPGSRTQTAPAPPTPGPAAAAPLPPLADAFAAILAAEQKTPESPAADWPATVTVGAAVTEDLVEQVARRVLERLSDRIVRETTAEIVSAVAERVVREEIEKLKRTIK
jgi:CheY-like chemotaxis protein